MADRMKELEDNYLKAKKAWEDDGSQGPLFKKVDDKMILVKEGTKFPLYNAYRWAEYELKYYYKEDNIPDCVRLGGF